MKKHKSVVAILLAVMMIFTMMPAMAFASVTTGEGDNAATWNDDFSKVTIGGYEYNTVRTYDGGIITATPDPDTDVAWAIPSDAVTYIDLNEAELATADGTTLKATYNNGTASTGTYTKGSVAWVKLNVPSYVKNKDTAKAAYKQLAGGLNAKWTAVAEGDKDYDPASKKAQEFTISVSGTWDSGARTAPYLIGSIKSKTVKINAATLNPTDAKFFFDSEEAGTTGDGSANNPLEVYYDGSEHTLMATPIDGWTPSFGVWNATKGVYDSVAAVKLTDIQMKGEEKKPVEVRVQWTKAGETKPTDAYEQTLYANLKKAGTAYVGFILGDDDNVYTVDGTSYNAADYVDVAANVTYKKGMQDTEEDKTRTKAKLLDAATAKAVAANKAKILALFNELYDVTETVSKYNPNAVKLEIDSKDLTSKEVKAITDKYADLLSSLSVKLLDEDANVALENNGVVALNGVDITDFEIEFTKAPAKKVIKTKKAKSTKTVKFNVKAECKNGTLVKYKLINAPKGSVTIDANTGKITVKKGLAKGTYTFKVKAYIPVSRIHGIYEGYEGTAVSEIQTIKVVVKKTKK